jgi:hypothetical protein
VRASLQPKSPPTTSATSVLVNFEPGHQNNGNSSGIVPMSIDESKLLPRGRSDSSSSTSVHDSTHAHRGAIDEYFQSSIWRVCHSALSSTSHRESC